MALKKFDAHSFIHAHPAHLQMFIFGFSPFEMKNREHRLTDQAEIRKG
jgi:hypothetical protein